MGHETIATFTVFEPAWGSASLWFLIASIAILLLGPLLFHLFRSRAGLMNTIDGFVLIAVTGLVLLHVIPHAVQEVGWWSIGFAAIGFWGPAFAERWHHKAAHRTHRFALALVIVGLVLHAAVDGMALNNGQLGEQSNALPAAIVLHRLTVGLTIWWLIEPAYGPKWAWGMLSMMVLSTVVGFGIGGAAALSQHGMLWGFFEALVGGMLLHVIFHLSHGDGAPRKILPGWRLDAGLGALFGGALVWILTAWEELGHTEGSHSTSLFGEAFFALALESAPMLLLAYLAAGLVHAFFSESTVAWMRRGTPLRQALRGMAFGLPLPVCSCGVVPLYQGLVTRGAPPAAAMAFLVATPELGLDAALLSLPLLGAEMTVARVGAAALVALIVGWLIGPLAATRGDGNIEALDEENPAGETVTEKISYGVRIGFGEVVDRTGPWIVLGLLLAAVMVPALDADAIAQVPRGVDVLVFALVGMPTYVCASGATPFVAILLLKGASPGAALAFLLSGPATNIVTFGVLSRLHGRKVAVAFGASIAVLSIALGLLLNQFLPTVSGFSMTAHEHGETNFLGWACLFGLFAVFILSVLRQGPRAFFGQIFQSEGGADDSCSSESADCHDESHCGDTPDLTTATDEDTSSENTDRHHH